MMDSKSLRAKVVCWESSLLFILDISDCAEISTLFNED